MVDISAYPAWCRFWCHPPPCFVPPRKSALWLTFSGFSFPGLPSCAVAAIALVRWLSSLASPPQPRSPMGPLYRKQGAPERWEMGGRGPALSTGDRSGVRLGQVNAWAWGTLTHLWSL